MKKNHLLLALFVAFTACSTPARNSGQKYNSVVILGNSIVRHMPKADIGWGGPARGMASSVPDSDMVHLLTARFHAAVPSSRVAAKNIAEWEGAFWKYDLSQLDTLRQMHPDLLVVRIGENVNPDSAKAHNFALHLARLIKYLSGSAQPKVVVFGSFWDSPVVGPLEAQMCTEAGFKFVPLSGLSADPANTAGLQRFPNPGVAHHPGDQGMRLIARTIWENI